MTKLEGRRGAGLVALAALAGLIFAGCEGGPTPPPEPPRVWSGSSSGKVVGLHRRTDTPGSTFMVSLGALTNS